MSRTIKKLIGRSLSLGLVCALWPAVFIVGLAQSDNTQISGFVKDPNGAVIANAKVTVRSEARDFERNATTNSEGYYVITQLPSGLYTISVEAQGFKLHKETGKKLDPNVPATVDVLLQTGQVTEVVNVTASTSTVQTETATVGKLVDRQQIENIQLNGRNPLFLALLKPGVNGGALGQFSFGLTTGGLNINGSRTQDNLITFDGAVAVRTRSNGTSIGVADADSTQEVQILTANYNAEYGRSAGGQVRIVTRSGTRDFHGTAYEFIRNSALNANSFSRNHLALADCGVNPKADNCRPSPFRYNQFGYNLSGPVLLPFTSYNKDRNKIFWLFGQEWVKQRAASTTITTVPSLKMRNGDFSELLDPTNRYYGKVVTITDPTTGQPFAGNIIPANRVSANGLALLRAYPEPTAGFVGPGSANFTQTRPTRTDQRKDTISIDFYPTEKHQIRWRAQLYHFVDVSAFRANTDRAPQIIDRPNQTTSLNWVWTISPTWVNELLATASRDQVFIAVDTAGNTYQRSKYGINYPYIFPNNKEIFDKIPTINFGGVFTDLDGGPYPSSSKGPIYDISDNVTNIRGNHTIKAGFAFERAGENDFDQINVSGVPGGTNNQNGRFEFRNGVGGTGLDIANAAIGVFSSYAEIDNRSYTPYRGHMYEWFIQDGWKVTPKLRLELGLRHTIIQPYYSLWRNMAVFDEKFYDPSIAAVLDKATGFIISGDLKSRYNGLVIPGDGFPDSAKGPGRVPVANTGQFDFLFRGVDKQYSEIHYNNFQPRIGVAYAFNQKNVLRAGAGRFITRLGVSDSVFLGGNPPFQPIVSISNGKVDNPGGGTSRAFTQNITTQDRIFKNPEAWAWNVTFERELGFDTTVEVAYVGRRGLHGQRERNINQLPVGTCPNGNCPFIDPANTSLGRINPDFLRPFKGYNTIRRTNNEANSRYNGLQIGVNRRFTKGLLFGVAYTYSKSSDDGSAQRDIIPNAFDASNLYGPSDFDRRHVMVVNVVYQLPFFRDQARLSGRLLGGWTLSAVSQFQTGTPFSIGTGDDFAGVGPGSGAQLWILNGGNPQLDRGDRKFSLTNSDSNQWFQVCTTGGPLSSCPTASRVFTEPAAGTISNQSVRNLLYGPGFQNHNIGLLKDFAITEHHKVQFRAEAFNWVNHPNWNGPNTNPRSAAFGKIQDKNSERTLQFALRYQF
ncbi:MAG TPA: carboxypeptidase regulatory-like domain-containing protein [Blastocatellia bacterium]|nr:carboxypeptidase regulatory-like domain-containing protein [Blastocatellia bacterium]